MSFWDLFGSFFFYMGYSSVGWIAYIYPGFGKPSQVYDGHVYVYRIPIGIYYNDYMFEEFTT